ncbi:MAG: hypothetical protein IJX99_03125 [Clostridia bacterium]|nr:hypothetical protein [Clostridia bacterium]MBQ8298847.1 hypothetical protein [Clostridia bacterium]
MPELQLKVVKNTGDGIWGKALNNFNKVLYSSGGGLFNIVINSKRNSLLRASANYEEIATISNEKKRNTVAEKYEKVYDNYLNTLEKYITDTVYNRVQKRIGTIKENKLISEYYETNSLKGTEYCEYKYKRQLMLLQMDWETIVNSKSGYFVEKYKKFYSNVADQLYKGLMKHYSVKLTNKNEDKNALFEKIYSLIDGYIKFVLPYLAESEGREKVLDGYKNYVEKIDMYAKKEINSLKKDLYLLELGISLFVYCLPILATEECYMDLLERARRSLPNIYITADKFEMYNLLLDVIESYAYNVWSKKSMWESDIEKQDFENFWAKLTEYKKLQRIDLNEYKKVREILFITYELKLFKKENKEYKELRAYYRDRMKQLGGLRKFKNSYKKMSGAWKTRRRCKAE